MNKLHVKYLIVGGGIAGASAAQSIRAFDREGELLLIAQEATRPYHRGPLSRQALRQRLPRSELFIHPPGWYEQRGIELRTGRRVAHLDIARNAAQLDDAQEISYDKLLLATGAAARHLTIPGRDLPGLHYLRTYQDLERILHAVDKAKNEGIKHHRNPGGRGRVAVIGSGLLALELADSFTAIGLEVELLLKGEHPWTRFAGPTAGKWAARVLEQLGVGVHAHGAPLRLEGDGRVQRVIATGDLPIPCDFAIAAVGAVASRELLRGTPIAAEKAILTDPYCRTSVEDVYAAGDCAAILDGLYGKYRILDHFENARELGELAGRNMAGDPRAYTGINHYATALAGSQVHVWGEARHVHHRLVRGAATPDAADFIEFGLTADDRISQVIAVNHAHQDALLKQLVETRTNTAGREEQFKDPTSPLESLL